jgi:hypothetical protein
MYSKVFLKTLKFSLSKINNTHKLLTNFNTYKNQHSLRKHQIQYSFCTRKNINYDLLWLAKNKKT